MSLILNFVKSLRGGSDGKESACNAGYLGSIPGSGRSSGEGTDSPLQYSCLAKELMLLNYGVGEDSLESLVLQGDQTSQS